MFINKFLECMKESRNIEKIIISIENQDSFFNKRNEGKGYYNIRICILT